VIWAGGISASPLGRILASRTNAETDKGGRVKVKPDLTLPNYPDIYVIGDLASATDEKGRPLPGLAQVAMQGGQYAATAILRKVKGKQELPPFHYFDKGTLAVIGRAAAVADVFGAHLSGPIAWLVWVFIHLMYLVNFQSRALVFIQMGSPGSDIQPWSPINHRRCSHRLQFHQRTIGSTCCAGIKP
jgi:NADH dehydrogenase